MKSRSIVGILGGLALVLHGCGGPDSSKGDAAGTVVVYSALDREFAEPVLKAYAKRTGVDGRCPSSTSRAPRRSA